MLLDPCPSERGWVSNGGKLATSLVTSLHRIEASLIKTPSLMALLSDVSPDVDPDPTMCMFNEVDASYVRNRTSALS